MAVGRVDDAASFLFGAWKARPRSNRVLSLISLALAITGLLMLGYPFITNIYTSEQQSRLAEDFKSPELRSLFAKGEVADGQVLTRIQIPKIGVDALIVEGTDAQALRAGAGHYKGTSLPCQRGNVGIAGHRTTYGKPFNRLDELSTGDTITLITPESRCTYQVIVGEPKKSRPHPGAASWITNPNDGGVLAQSADSLLTLTTCHPKGSAAKRLILRARLIS